MIQSRTGRSQFVARVTVNAGLCREHFRLVLTIDESFPPTDPGQFVQLLCRNPSDLDWADTEREWSVASRPSFEGIDLLAPTALLRRPFSLAGRRDLPDGATEIDIIHRVVGVGTDWLSKLKPGDDVGVLGPLGNVFDMPAPGQTALVVGGGVGIPPMLYLVERLAREGRQAIAFCGATTRDLMPLTIVGKPTTGAGPAPIVQEFARHGFPSVLATDDGTLGFHGYITQALEGFFNSAICNPQSAILYTCGPELMMRRVAQIGESRNIPVQIAVERAMACGMGTCQSCCIRAVVPKEIDPAGWRYKLACTDGPVFRSTDLLW